MITKEGRTPNITPFDMSGVERSDAGVLRYTGMPQSLLHMFRDAVARTPDRECIVVLGGERVTYQQVWDRATRVAGGLVEAGVRPGDRVANRYGNSLEWCLAFWGTIMAGGVVVPVNARFSDAEVDYVVTDSGSSYVFQPDAALPYCVWSSARACVNVPPGCGWMTICLYPGAASSKSRPATTRTIQSPMAPYA